MRRIMAVGVKLNLRNRPYLVRLRKRMRTTSASHITEFLTQIQKSNQIIKAVREYYRAVLILQKYWRSRCAVYEVRARAIGRHPRGSRADPAGSAAAASAPAESPAGRLRNWRDFRNARRWWM
jgi:hypothetical protein